jgi:hypothetical protein
VAVAVQALPHIVLDEHYVIVEVGPAAEAAFRPLEGRNLWECFPDSEPLFRPYYEQARRTGAPVEFVQFYAGAVGWVRATPEGNRLALTWERLARLDTLTFSGLQTTLSEALELLEVHEAEARRSSLRLVGAVTDG